MTSTTKEGQTVLRKGQPFQGKKRKLTTLANKRPQRLDLTPNKLDVVVAEAHG